MAALTRVCARCHGEQPIEAFPIKIKARGTRRSYCLPCCREYGKEDYRRNKPSYLAKNVTARVRQRQSNRDVAYEYLVIHPCVDRGEPDPVVLDFDHVDPKTKSWTIGKMLSRQASPGAGRACAPRSRNATYGVRTATGGALLFSSGGASAAGDRL